MAWNVWRGACSPLAQQETYTPANVEVNDVFTLTFTDDYGATVAVSYTATAATVANVTAGLTAACKASAHPQFSRITVSDETTLVRITSTTAGRPFRCAASTTDGGGTNNQTLTKATVQPNVGPNDVQLAGNWSLGHTPLATEDILIPEGSGAMLYGLDLSSIAIGQFVRHPKHLNNIGRIEDGELFDLRIDPDSCSIRGGGSLVAVNVGTAAIPVTIEHSGDPASTARHGCYIRGSAITTLEVQDGDVGLADWPNHTATVTSQIRVSPNAKLEIGSGVTVSGVTSYSNQADVVSWVSVPTVEVRGGTYAQRAGNWTTAKVYRAGSRQGVLYADAGGTYATTEAYDDSVIDASRTRVAKTYTTRKQYGSSLLYDPWKVCTTTTLTDESYEPTEWSGGGFGT